MLVRSVKQTNPRRIEIIGIKIRFERIGGGDLFKIPEVNIFPVNFAFTASVNLESDKAACAFVVSQIGAGDTVDPGQDLIALCMNGESVPI